MRIGKIHSRLYVDGASITYDRWTVRLRRSPPGAASERQYTLGGRRRPGRNGETCVRVSSTGAYRSMFDLNKRTIAI